MADQLYIRSSIGESLMVALETMVEDGKIPEVLAYRVKQEASAGAAGPGGLAGCHGAGCEPRHPPPSPHHAGQHPADTCIPLLHSPYRSLAPAFSSRWSSASPPSPLSRASWTPTATATTCVGWAAHARTRAGGGKRPGGMAWRLSRSGDWAAAGCLGTHQSFARQGKRPVVGRGPGGRPSSTVLSPFPLQVWDFKLRDVTFRLSPTQSSNKKDDVELKADRIQLVLVDSKVIAAAAGN